MILFLDDIRSPSFVGLRDQNVVIARSFREFCDAVESYVKINGELFSTIHFDHDLSIDDVCHFIDNPESATSVEKTGLDCAKWLIEYCMAHNLKMCKFKVHSMNPVGKINIESLLTSFTEFQNG